MRARCRAIVDEKVVDAWELEVAERGDKWLEASKLLAAYGYGAPPRDLDDDATTRSDPLVGLTIEEARALARQSLRDDAQPADEDNDDEDTADEDATREGAPS